LSFVAQGARRLSGALRPFLLRLSAGCLESRQGRHRVRALLGARIINVAQRGSGGKHSDNGASPVRGGTRMRAVLGAALNLAPHPAEMARAGIGRGSDLEPAGTSGFTLLSILGVQESLALRHQSICRRFLLENHQTY
jgi:hypothetical protein